MGKLTGIEAARGVAALLVLLYHATKVSAETAYLGGYLPLNGLFYFGGAGVDFFFVLSGFIILHVHAGDIGRPQRLPNYGWRRLVRIYPVYWIVTALVIPPFMLVSHYGLGHEGGPAFLLKSVFLVPQELNPVIGVAWTLVHEMQFYLLFALLILDRRVGVIVLGLWFAVCVASAPFGMLPRPAGYVISVYNLQFLIGMLVALALRRVRLPAPRLVLLAGALSFFATGMADVAFTREPDGFAGAWAVDAERSAYGASAAAVVWGLAAAETEGRLRLSGLPVLVGAASYSTYLTHYFTLSALAKAILALGLNAHLPPPLLFWGLVAGALAVGVAFHLTVERPLLAFLHVRFAPSPRTDAGPAAADRLPSVRVRPRPPA